MDFTIPESLRMLSSSVRDYVRRRLEPLAQQVEREDRIPPEILREMAALGYFGLPFPEQYGGAGVGELGYCLALEELGKTNAAYTNILGAHCSLASTAIYLAGSEAQKQKYLAPLARGEKLASFALTESNAGSDAAALQTTAVLKDSGYVLSGSKIWITNGPVAGVIVVFAATDRAKGARGGISAFIVESSFPGFKVGKIDEKMGLRGSQTAELIFDDCWVPAENLLGPEGAGFLTAMKTLDLARISLGAGAVGSAQDLLERSIKHAKARVQFGRPIAANQGIQWMLAELAVQIHAARLMVYQAAWKADRGERVSREAAMLKLFASEVAGQAADMAVQIHGGLGYMKEMGIERAYRDARILRIYEGTNEIQKLVIAEELLKD